MPRPTDRALSDVRAERAAQDERWGPQHHPDGTARPRDLAAADVQRQATDDAAATGALTWRDILSEEVAEAFAEADPDELRAELVQVAAVAVAWVEDIDRRAR